MILSSTLNDHNSSMATPTPWLHPLQYQSVVVASKIDAHIHFLMNVVIWQGHGWTCDTPLIPTSVNRPISFHFKRTVYTVHKLPALVAERYSIDHKSIHTKHLNTLENAARKIKLQYPIFHTHCLICSSSFIPYTTLPHPLHLVETV